MKVRGNFAKALKFNTVVLQKRGELVGYVALCAVLYGDSPHALTGAEIKEVLKALPSAKL